MHEGDSKDAIPLKVKTVNKSRKSANSPVKKKVKFTYDDSVEYNQVSMNIRHYVASI